MPTWLSFMGAAVATLGLFGGLYTLVTLFIAAKKRGADPQFGLLPGDKPGQLKFWAKWNPEVVAVQVYRFKFSHASPFARVKEGNFSVTFDPPQKESFSVAVEIPAVYNDLFAELHGVIFTLELKIAEGFSLAETFSSK